MNDDITGENGDFSSQPGWKVTLVTTQSGENVRVTSF